MPTLFSFPQQECLFSSSLYYHILLRHPLELKNREENTERGRYKAVSQADEESLTSDKTGGRSQTESVFFAYFRRRMHRPILRIIADHLTEVIFLISLTLTLVDPLDEKKGSEVREKKIQPYDYITAVYSASYLLDELFELFRKRGKMFTSLWRVYDIVRTSLLCVGGLMMTGAFYYNLEDDNRAQLSGNHPVNVGAALFLLGSTLSLLKPLRHSPTLFTAEILFFS